MHLVAIESRNSVIVCVFTMDIIYTVVPLVTITTMCNAEYQSNYNLQLPYKFDGRIDYWKCIYVIFDLIIVYWTFLGNYAIPRFFFFSRKPPKKDYLSFYQPNFFSFRVVCTFNVNKSGLGWSRYSW